MNRRLVWIAVGAALLCAGPSHAKEKAKKEKVVQAQRAGWMLGLFVGEEKSQSYPFVLDVNPQSDAKLKGVRKGDEIIRLEGEEPTSLRRLFDQVNQLTPGREVSLWVRRSSQTLHFRLPVPKNPTGAPAPEAGKKAEDNSKDASGSAAAEDGKKKKRRKRPPIVFKPIPSGEKDQ